MGGTPVISALYAPSEELVFTTLTREGMPFIRYESHDLASMSVTP